ncbi:MAG: CBS domain-containing protein [Ectothiorhodospiraceae bacterium]|nr:CBS domain-containing protein [Ectothiorhodospiraceae bacterium]
MRIGEICNARPVTVARGASVIDAARLMREHHVGDVVVVEETGDGARPVGILTDRDIVIEVVAREVPLTEVSVGDVMSFDLLRLDAMDPVSIALEQMRERAVRRAPVIDTEGLLVGVVSIDDLLGFLAREITELYALVVRAREQERALRD